MSCAMYWEVKNINRCAQALDILKSNNYHGEELTKKQFDALFKGLKICSIDWLTHHGFYRDYCESTKYNRNLTAFATITRIEEFELKDKFTEGYKLVSEKGEVITDVTEYDYHFNKTIKSLVDKIYGKCEMKKIKTPIIGKRYFYTINMDELAKCTGYSASAIKYYTEKYEKTMKLATRYKTILDNIMG